MTLTPLIKNISLIIHDLEKRCLQFLKPKSCLTIFNRLITNS